MHFRLVTDRQTDTYVQTRDRREMNDLVCSNSPIVAFAVKWRKRRPSVFMYTACAKKRDHRLMTINRSNLNRLKEIHCILKHT